MAQTYKPMVKQVKFENPKESAQNGYEFANAIAKRLRKEKRKFGLNSMLATDIKKIWNDYHLYEAEIEARS